jgi:hypothetical protein
MNKKLATKIFATLITVLVCGCGSADEPIDIKPKPDSTTSNTSKLSESSDTSVPAHTINQVATDAAAPQDVQVDDLIKKMLLDPKNADKTPCKVYSDNYGAEDCADCGVRCSQVLAFVSNTGGNQPVEVRSASTVDVKCTIGVKGPTLGNYYIKKEKLAGNHNIQYVPFRYASDPGNEGFSPLPASGFLNNGKVYNGCNVASKSVLFKEGSTIAKYEIFYVK